MSSSRFTEGRGLKVLVGALLAVHVAWIGVHLSLVADDAINPWKLGGYGMYTVPHPRARAHVYLIDKDTQAWSELQDGTYNTYAFDSANHLHVFRCRPPSEASIVGFLDENAHLRYRPMTIALSEVRFTEDPIGEARRIHAKVEIAWGGRERFGYRGEICGETFEGQAAYTPPS